MPCSGPGRSGTSGSVAEVPVAAADRKRAQPVSLPVANSTQDTIQVVADRPAMGTTTSRVHAIQMPVNIAAEAHACREVAHKIGPSGQDDGDDLPAGQPEKPADPVPGVFAVDSHDNLTRPLHRRGRHRGRRRVRARALGPRVCR